MSEQEYTASDIVSAAMERQPVEVAAAFNSIMHDKMTDQVASMQHDFATSFGAEGIASEEG